MAKSDLSGAGLSFLEAFSYYIRIDFSCKQLNPEAPHEFLEELQNHIPALCKDCTATPDGPTLILWPTLFTTCKADAIISKDAHQDRGSFLVGINVTNLESINSVLRLWESNVKTSTFFVDYIPTPLVAVQLVRREELGRLIIDEWGFPVPQASSPLFFGHENSDSGDEAEALSFFQHAASSASPKGETCTPVTAVTRSHSPGGKKLTPAASILNRLKWDAVFSSKDFIVIYEDRHDGFLEVPVDLWTTESTEEHFIPMHRIRAIKRRSTGQIVWHREERIDLISSEGK